MPTGRGSFLQRHLLKDPSPPDTRARERWWHACVDSSSHVALEGMYFKNSVNRFQILREPFVREQKLGSPRLPLKYTRGFIRKQ